MKAHAQPGPQGSLLFRMVAFFSRLQLGYLIRSVRHPRFLVVMFVFVAGAIALGIITLAAYLIALPLLFPPLGPSAFILFHTPMSITASPRNVVLSHTMAVAVGIGSLGFAAMLWPNANLSDPSVMNWYRVAVIALSMGLIGLMMVTVRCVHPPAAASALIAAMGYLANAAQVLGLLAAVVLLVLEAFVFNRMIGGLPYPLWRADPAVSRNYGLLAGIPEVNTNFWQQLTTKIFQHR